MDYPSVHSDENCLVFATEAIRFKKSLKVLGVQSKHIVLSFKRHLATFGKNTIFDLPNNMSFD
jgi:hypothetical protein